MYLPMVLGDQLRAARPLLVSAFILIRKTLTIGVWLPLLILAVVRGGFILTLTMEFILLSYRMMRITASMILPALPISALQVWQRQALNIIHLIIWKLRISWMKTQTMALSVWAKMWQLVMV